MKNLALTIAIPAYNEEDNIEKAILLALKVAGRLGIDYEILVVDDGSKDQTPKILTRLSRKCPQLRVITHKENLGIEPSLKDLYKNASGKITFFNGADNEIRMTILPEMIKKMHQGNDIVVAQRISKKYNLFRHALSWGFNFLIKMFFRFDPYDAGCAKLFKTSIYQNIEVNSKSVFGEAERLIKASKNGYKIASIKVIHYPNQKPSSVKLMTPLLAFRDLVWLLIRN